MPDTKNPTMKGNQCAIREPLVDLVSRKASGQELLPSHDAMAAAGESGENLLDCLVFGCHWRP
jgi:hypothetical protein